MRQDPQEDASTAHVEPDGSKNDTPLDAGAPSAVDASAIAPCMVGGNVFHVEGDIGDPVYPAAATLRSGDGNWSGQTVGDVQLAVTVEQQGRTSWAFIFSDFASQRPLHEGTYENVGGLADRLNGPIMQLYVDGRSCDAPRSRVTLVSFVQGQVQPALESATVMFEQHCDGLSPALRGCVHFER